MEEARILGVGRLATNRGLHSNDIKRWLYIFIIAICVRRDIVGFLIWFVLYRGKGESILPRCTSYPILEKECSQREEMKSHHNLNGAETSLQKL